MKRLAALATCLLIAVATLSAQQGQDFARRFLSLYGEKYELSCHTISPQMMERILQLDDVENNEQTQQFIAQLKSIRILNSEASEDVSRDLYDKAEALAHRNKRRYAVHAYQGGQSVYTRRHGKKLVEVVLVKVKPDHTFYMIDLTGNLSDDFIAQVLKM